MSAQSPPPARYIEVQLLKARNLPKFDTFGASDPFATVSLGEENDNVDESSKFFKSAVKMDTLDPEWNETFVFKEEGEEELIVKLFDYNSHSAPELMTVTRLPTAEILSEESKDGKWYPLTKQKSDKEAGELCMKIIRFIDFRELKDRATQFRENMEKLQDENAALTETAKKNSLLERQVVDLSADIERLKKEHGELESEKDSLEARATQLDHDLSEANDKNEEVSSELEIALASAQDKDSADESVQKRLVALSQKYQHAEQQRKIAETKGNQALKQVKQAAQQLQSETRKFEQLSRKYDDLNDQYRRLEGALQRVQAEHRALQRKYEAATSPQPVAGRKSNAPQRSKDNTFGEFLTGLGLVFVLYLHRAQNIK